MVSTAAPRNACVTYSVLPCVGSSKDQALEPTLPRAAVFVAAMIRGRKSRPARWMSLCCDLQAVVALEYALIAGVMVFVVFTVSTPFATALATMFTRVASGL
jgi:Flp pilus assembly pilin Flp